MIGHSGTAADLTERANQIANLSSIYANQKHEWTPHANYHIERHEAYKLLGKDPRTRKMFYKYF